MVNLLSFLVGAIVRSYLSSYNFHASRVKTLKSVAHQAKTKLQNSLKCSKLRFNFKFKFNLKFVYFFWGEYNFQKKKNCTYP